MSADRSRQRIDIDQKALEINLNKKIYGTIAEIGAGQEVARYFFKVGAASGTIAKSMSAYDKTYSDAIYGPEESGRFVCESRLYKMLDHEYGLIMERLAESRLNSTFFAFADTVATMNYKRTIQGHGWLGVRFQTEPQGPANDLILHVRLLDNTPQLQQAAIGRLGVSLIYACFNYSDNVPMLVQSLGDDIEGRLVIDMIRLTGPSFHEVDNRLMALLLVEQDLTEVAMIDATGNCVHASEIMWKHSLMVVRGTYCPPTLVSKDAIDTSYAQFLAEDDVDPERAWIMPEITLDNLRRDGDLSRADFIERVKALNAMGHAVIVSNCENHQRLINYLSEYKINQLGLVIGARELLQIIRSKHDENQDGRLLIAFGELFNRNITIYVYPAKHPDTGEVLKSENLPVPEGIEFIYQHLLRSGQIVDVEDVDLEALNIYGYKVHQMIQSFEPGWEEMVPSKVVDIIKSEGLFQHPASRIEFEY